MQEAEVEKVKRYLQEGRADGHGRSQGGLIKGLPARFFEAFVMQCLRPLLLEPGRLICSLKVPPRLLKDDDLLHGGVTAMLVDGLGWIARWSAGLIMNGVSVEINVSYFVSPCLDEEIEIEAKALHIGQSTATVTVELRKKNGKIIAVGRHTVYLNVHTPSKM